MKDFKDVTPTEKKRETKIQKEKKLEEETRERKKKKAKTVEEKKEEEKPTTLTEEVKPEAVKPEEAVKKEVKEKPKEKKPKPKPKPIEKIKYSAKKEVPEFKLKKKKPKFRRQEHYKKRLKPVWRKPTGIDSKQHEGKRGKGKIPGIGYKNPNIIQGLHPFGYWPVLIHNMQELTKIDPKTQGAVIASAVGRKKRNEIIKEANKLQITILNPRKGEL